MPSGPSLQEQEAQPGSGARALAGRERASRTDYALASASASARAACTDLKGCGDPARKAAVGCLPAWGLALRSGFPCQAVTAMLTDTLRRRSSAFITMKDFFF